MDRTGSNTSPEKSQEAQRAGSSDKKAQEKRIGELGAKYSSDVAKISTDASNYTKLVDRTVPTLGSEQYRDYDKGVDKRLKEVILKKYEEEHKTLEDNFVRDRNELLK